MNGLLLYEDACHEDNHGLPNALADVRAAAAAKGTREQTC
jgi:hypothetical protein